MSSSSSTNENNIGIGDIGKESPSKEKMNSLDDKYWREKIEVSSAKARKIRGGNYVQLATVDPQTFEPRCRTVVFRGFLQQPQSEQKSCIMKMITDGRSNKVTEVKNQNADKATAEMVWWFPKSSEQYRIRGKLIFVGSEASTESDDESDFLSAARKQQWGNLSDMAREQFYWNDPGAPYEGDAKVPAGGRDEDGKVLPPPDNFLLMLLYPNRVDYLRLTDNFHQIDELNDDEWTFKRVNP